MNINKSRKGGFTLVEIMIVVTVIGLLAAIAIPNFIVARSRSQNNACINNLRQIDNAVQEWALENKKAAAAPVSFTDISSYLRNSVICPAGGATFLDSYTISDVGAKPFCLKAPLIHVYPPDTGS